MTASSRLALRVARLGVAIGVLVVAIAALPWLRGEDPARTVLRSRFTARGDDPAAVDALRRELGAPADPWSGALGWLGRILHGDLGTSWRSGRPVSETAVPALQVSSSLALLAVVVALIVCLAVVAGPAWRATRRGTPLPPRVGAMSSVLAAVPEVVVGSLLVLVLAVWLRLLPATGWSQPRDVLLPALALGIPAGGLLARLVTGVVDQTLAEPWASTWRANGVPRRAVVRTVARRVVGHMAPQVVVVTVSLLGAAVAVEQVFALPGAGSLAVDSALAQDLPVLQACVAGFLLLGLAMALLAAALHRWALAPALHHDEALPLRLPAPASSRIWVPAAGFLALVLAAGLPRDGSTSNLDDRLAEPSLTHPFGADAVGHDLLGRLADGTVLTIGLAVGITAVAFGIALAVGPWARHAGVAITDVWVTVPSTIVGIAVASAAGPGLAGASLAVLLVSWIPLTVHARTLAVSAWAAGHVQAATLAGSGTLRTWRLHVVPAVAGPLLRHALVRVPANALGLAGLSFIGLGADPDAAELGAILADGLRYLERAPWVSTGPALVLIALGCIGGTALTGPGRRGLPSTR